MAGGSRASSSTERQTAERRDRSSADIGRSDRPPTPPSRAPTRRRPRRRRPTPRHHVPEGGADLGRRKFFRQFAGDIATTAATVMGAAQALQRTSAELAGAILDPTQLESTPDARAGRYQYAAGDRRHAGLPDGLPCRAGIDRLRRPAGVAPRNRRARSRDRGRGDLGDPRRGRERRPGIRPGGRHRDCADRRPRPGDPTLRPPGDISRRGQRDEQRRPIERIRGQRDGPRDGRVRRSRRAVGGRRRDRGGDAGGGGRDPRRSRGRPRGASSRRASPCWHELPRADDTPLRILVHGPAASLAGGQFGTALSIPMTAHQRDVAIRVILPEGRPRFTGSRISCLGARCGRCPAPARRRCGGRVADRRRRGRRGPRPGGPGGRERRCRRSHRDLPARGRRSPSRRPRHRLRRGERRDAGHRRRRGDRDRLPRRRGPRSGRRQGADTPGNGKPRPDPRHDAGRAHHDVAVRGRSADAAIRTAARHRAAELERAPVAEPELEPEPVDASGEDPA